MLQRWIYLGLLAIVFLFGITFALSNSDPVQLRYYFGEWHAPLSIIVVVAFVTGIVLGMLSAGLVLLRLRRQLRHKTNALRLAEEEIVRLRGVGVTPPGREGGA